MLSRFVFNFTPTGMVPTREMTPHVPLSPAEVIEDVLAASAWGINVVHLHARDPATGKPSPDPALYAEIIRGIRAGAPDLVITVSTSGRDWSELEKRARVLDLDGDAKPDMASLTLSSLNFSRQASVNEPETIQTLAAMMKERGIRPELEVFDAGMINYARYLQSKGLIEPPFYFNIILGNIAGAQADPLHLGMMIRELPADSLWAAGGLGGAQLKANVMALASGGGVRVGIEDTIWLDEARTVKATNRELVRRIADIAGQLGLAPYTPAELRDALALPRKGGAA